MDNAANNRPKLNVRVIKATEPYTGPIRKAEGPTQLDTKANDSAGEFVVPPYPLIGLKNFVNNSSILPQCIAAYKNNIAGFGLGLRYVVEDCEETPEMKAEWDQAQEIIDLLTVDMDTKETFEDIIEARETYGIAYLEVMRNPSGQVNQVSFIRDVPSVEKTYPLNPPVLTSYNYQGTKVVQRPRRFCKYRQQVGGHTVYFKEFGDPRMMDNRTGEYVEVNTLGDILPIKYRANEIIDFAIGTELYGEVRWIGQLLGVDGSRMAESLNNNYFRNGRHTPLMICVKGGTLSDESCVKLRQYMDDVKGENGQHAFLVLEFENADNRADFEEGQKPDIEIKDLASILQKDELFQDYLENNRRRVQSSFRLPDLYTGYTTDFNRATAQTAMEVTEEQVFQPERKSLAWAINNRLLNGYGFKHVEAYFRAPDMSNPDDLFKILTVCEKAGGLTPNKARSIIADSLGEKAENYEGEWGDTPIAAKDLIAMQAQQQETAMPMAEPDLLSQLTGQIQKASSNHDDEIIPVLKEIRSLLKHYPSKPFTKPPKSSIIKTAWKESEHPRNDDGEFSNSGSSSSDGDGDKEDPDAGDKKKPATGNKDTSGPSDEEKAAREELNRRIESGAAKTKVDAKKQAKHIVGSKAYNNAIKADLHPSRLTLNAEETQAVVDKYIKTGHAGKHKDNSIRVKFTHDRSIGIYVSADGSIEQETCRGTIHISKSGTHIVPDTPEAQ